MSKIIITIISVVLLLIAGGVGKLIGISLTQPLIQPERPQSTYEEIEKKIIDGMKKAAALVNSNAPIMVDKDTRLDKVSVGPGPRSNYHYTLPNYTSKDFDPNLRHKKFFSSVKDTVCNNQDMKPSLQYGGMYTFSYSGNDGVEITSFEIDKTTCGFSDKTSQPYVKPNKFLRIDGKIVEVNNEKIRQKKNKALTEIELRSMASRDNEGLPKKIDDHIILFGLDVKFDELVYKYQITNIKKDDEYIMKLMEHQAPIVIKKTCTASFETVRLLEKGVNFTSIYYDDKNNIIGKICVTKNMCDSIN